MDSPITLFIRTFAIGIAVAAPVGAMGVLCIQRTLSRGWLVGFVTGAGIATADGIYAGFAAFGVVAVSQSLIAFQVPLRVAGGALLLWMGWRAISMPRKAEPVAVTDISRLGVLYVGSVGLTLTNPLTIMAFAAVFVSAGLVAQPGVASAATATLGVACGSLSWWLVLTTGTALGRHAASDRTLKLVNVVSGMLIIGFGVFALAAGVLAAI